MKLITFGDSWVWGDEIEPSYKVLPNGEYEYNGEYTEYRHLNNIGGVVNKNYKFTNYFNYAINGGSNSHILYQLSYYINSKDYNPDDLILIGLTSPLRSIRFNNISKTPTTWPGWDYESYTSYCDSSLQKNKDFENWWKSNLKVHVNSHNEILEYTQCCLSIKGLLANHSKYLVWQSIDGNFWDSINLDMRNVYLERYTIDGQEKEENINPFDKKNFETIINNGLSKSQIWINTTEPEWKYWLENNFNDVFVWSSNHPNEKGIKLWFDKILKKYIDKILDI